MLCFNLFVQNSSLLKELFTKMKSFKSLITLFLLTNAIIKTESTTYFERSKEKPKSKTEIMFSNTLNALFFAKTLGKRIKLNHKESNFAQGALNENRNQLLKSLVSFLEKNNKSNEVLSKLLLDNLPLKENKSMKKEVNKRNHYTPNLILGLIHSYNKTKLLDNIIEQLGGGYKKIPKDSFGLLLLKELQKEPFLISRPTLILIFYLILNNSTTVLKNNDKELEQATQIIKRFLEKNPRIIYSIASSIKYNLNNYNTISTEKIRYIAENIDSPKLQKFLDSNEQYIKKSSKNKGSSVSGFLLSLIGLTILGYSAIGVKKDITKSTKDTHHSKEENQTPNRIVSEKA